MDKLLLPWVTDDSVHFGIFKKIHTIQNEFLAGICRYRDGNYSGWFDIVLATNGNLNYKYHKNEQDCLDEVNKILFNLGYRIIKPNFVVMI